jgi:hypothetical protein
MLWLCEPAFITQTQIIWKRCAQWNHNGPITAHTLTRVARCAELLIVSCVVVVTREVTAFNTPHAHSLCKCKHTPVVACRRLKDGVGGPARHATNTLPGFQPHPLVSRCPFMYKPLCIDPQLLVPYRPKTNTNCILNSPIHPSPVVKGQSELINLAPHLSSFV